MGRKCCIDGCYSNYAASKAKNEKLKGKNDKKNIARTNVPVFGLPPKAKEAEERKR